MRHSKKLLDKKIALNSCEVNGGRAMGTTALCSQYTYGDHCGDKTTTMYNDQGQTIAGPSYSAWQT